MNPRINGIQLSLNAIEEEYRILRWEIYGALAAVEGGASLVDVKFCLDTIAKHASRIANLAEVEADSLAKHLNRNARVA